MNANSDTHVDASAPLCEPDLVLMGLRAAGKTTLGRAIAQNEQRLFIDIDDEILARTGHANISELFEQQGQARFREMEFGVLSDVLASPGSGGRIISLGGGTPTAPGAAQLLTLCARDGRIALVYLRCTPEETRRRLAVYGAGAQRPSLTGDDPLAEVMRIYEQRDPLYQQLASEPGGRILNDVESVKAGLALLEGWAR